MPKFTVGEKVIYKARKNKGDVYTDELEGLELILVEKIGSNNAWRVKLSDSHAELHFDVVLEYNLCKIEEPTMDLKAAYLAMQEASGIKPGDTVRVMRKAESYEMGWGQPWPRMMDIFVGKEYKVFGLSKYDQNGFILNSASGYAFPFFVLEVVKKAKPHFKDIQVSLSPHYLAIVKEDKVSVGCQNFTFDKIKELYEAVRQAEEYARLS
jgi:hypothetical protein